MPKKTFLSRISPTKKQETLLQSQLETCRWLYNTLLEDRMRVSEGTGETLSLYGQQALFPGLKETHPALREVHSQVLQAVAVRIDLAFTAFFRRVKAGEKPGFPRSPVAARSRTGNCRYPGWVLFVWWCTVPWKGKTACGRTTSAAGPDALRFFPERRRHRQAVARVHERVKFRRQNFTHQESGAIVNRFGIIAVEDLHVNRMVHHHCLAKSIHDAAWAAFAMQLSLKAAGRTEVCRRQSRLYQPGL